MTCRERLVLQGGAIELSAHVTREAATVPADHHGALCDRLDAVLNRLTLEVIATP